MRTITKLEPANPQLPTRKRVAAYARVSSAKDAQLQSLSAQVSYYSAYIQRHGDWEYCGVYADEAITGTKDERPEFRRLVTDCRNGALDMVVTKSISRFARNTVTMLETVRELKLLGVDVYFEKENIHSNSGDGEVMLTILASYAQEESRSVSENIKWRKRNDMKRGKTKAVKIFGYRSENGKLEIVPEEAEVVRMLFDEFLGGLGQEGVANKLNSLGIKSPEGCDWCSCTVRRILTNPKMCGNILHQTRYVKDHISKKQMFNRGELPMYLYENTHEGIVSKEQFDAVRAELTRRGKIGGLNDYEGIAFRKKIECAECGRKFYHTSNGKGVNKYCCWVCGGRDKRTGANCTAQQIPEPTLIKVTAEVLGLDGFDGGVFAETVEKIIAKPNRQLIFVFRDGSEVTTEWQRRKPVPYSKVGIEKRQGHNICYSIIGKGNGKVGERRKLKEKECEDNA